MREEARWSGACRPRLGELHALVEGSRLALRILWA